MKTFVLIGCNGLEIHSIISLKARYFEEAAEMLGGTTRWYVSDEGETHPNSSVEFALFNPGEKTDGVIAAAGGIPLTSKYRGSRFKNLLLGQVPTL